MNRVTVDFGAVINSELSCRTSEVAVDTVLQFRNISRKVHTMMSSTWQIRLTGSYGGGISARYKLNNVGDIIELYGTPVGTIIACDLTRMQPVTDCLPLISIDIRKLVNSDTDCSTRRFLLVETCRDITLQLL